MKKKILAVVPFIIIPILIPAYCMYYKPSEIQMCDESVNFSTLTMRVLKEYSQYIDSCYFVVLNSV